MGLPELIAGRGGYLISGDGKQKAHMFLLDCRVWSPNGKTTRTRNGQLPGNKLVDGPLVTTTNLLRVTSLSFLTLPFSGTPCSHSSFRLGNWGADEVRGKKECEMVGVVWEAVWYCSCRLPT